MDRLRLINTFIRVAETENFSSAAQSLHLSPQAVSAQIAQLEVWLGVRLFHRTTRRIAMTDEGQLFYEHCNAGLRTIDDAERKLRDRADEMQGKVRVFSSFSLGQLLVAPLLATFTAQHPDIQVELMTQREWPDTVDLRMDIGVIGGTLLNASLVARRAGHFTHLLCASPAYLRAHGTPQAPSDLLRHRCIGLHHPRTNRIWPWTFTAGNKLARLELPLALLTQDPAVQRQWVLHGEGIAQLPDYYARPLVATGTLQELALGYQGPRIDVHVFMPQREYVSRRCKLLNDFLYQHLRDALRR